jgi:hypothetical protein
MGSIAAQGLLDGVVSLRWRRPVDVADHALGGLGARGWPHGGQRQAKEEIRGSIWTLDADLKVYRTTPAAEHKSELAGALKRSSRRTRGYVSPDRLLNRLSAESVGAHRN